jgi:hypothetical protein
MFKREDTVATSVVRSSQKALPGKWPLPARSNTIELAAELNQQQNACCE